MDEQSPRHPDARFVVALSSLPHIGPARLQALLGAGMPDDVWKALVAGRPPAAVLPARVVDEVTAAARATDVDALWATHLEAGWQILTPDDPRWPAQFLDDPEPPGVLFVDGRVGCLAGPKVAIVGTRRCTRYGRDIAAELGAGLTSLGLGVVSGLALGIDAAAHAGALGQPAATDAGSPVAVVAGDLGRSVPRANSGLRCALAQRGAVVSETTIGAPMARWRFPARNRLVAALTVAVVVVESGLDGGSMYTVDEALARGRPVFAVPGSVRSPASVGTNRLLSDGALVCTSVDDLVTQLGMALTSHSASGVSTVGDEPTGPDHSADAMLLWDALEAEPMVVDDLIADVGLSVGRALGALDELLRSGWAIRNGATVQRRR